VALMASLGCGDLAEFNEEGVLGQTHQASTGDWTLKNVNIQGMGYVTNIVIHPNTAIAPNYVYAKTDVGGIYRFDNAQSRWVQLLDGFDMSGALELPKPFNIRYVESIAVDPFVANDLYLVSGSAQNGRAYKSTDRGNTWTAITFPSVFVNGNGDYRAFTGERLVFDPLVANVRYFSSRQDGLWRYESGSWAKVGGGLPQTATDPGHTFIVFDKSSGTQNGRTKTQYVGVYGNGVYRSTDGGANFSRISTETNPLRGAVASDGTFYVVFGNHENTYSGPGAVRRYASGSWTAITPPAGTGRSYSNVVTHPTDANIVLVLNQFAEFYRSTNKGGSWTQLSFNYPSGVPGYYPSNWNVWGSGPLVVDPNDSTGATLWKTDGYAISKTTNVTSNNWAQVMLGLEELCTYHAIVPPVAGGAHLLTAVEDKIGFRHIDRDTVPNQNYYPSNTHTAQANGIDYCMSNPNIAAFVGWDQWDNTPLVGRTTDNGASWSSFNTAPGYGGNIAISATDCNRMVWAPRTGFGGTKAVQYTTNAGGSWAPVTGLPGNNWYRSSEWWSGRSLAADRVNGSKFYCLYEDPSTHVMSFYRSTNGGVNWSTTGGTLSGAPPTSAIVDIKAHPYVEGYLFIAFTPPWGEDGLVLPKLFRSTDSGTTFSQVSSVTGAAKIGFGKGTSNSNPFLYMYGRTNSDSIDGFYQSRDMGSTWIKLASGYGHVNDVEGDLRQQDLFYAALEGRGIVYGVPSSSSGSCSDGIKNNDETDIDCGGSTTCADCANGKTCLVNADCLSNLCSGGVCTAPAASCTDGIKNQNETDVDCGGSTVCSDCANGKTCLVNADCVSNNCVSGTCQAASGSANLRAQYYPYNTNPTDNAIVPYVRVYNDGSTALNLSDITYRYYFSNEGIASSVDYWYASHNGASWREITSGNVVFTLTSTYLQVGFTSGAGTLSASSFVNVQQQIRPTNWSGTYNESNDYSYDSSLTNYTNHTKITVYHQGALIWGTPEGGAPPASCTDSIKNQNETDIDCGGSTVCSDCANGKTCLVNADCVSNNCASGVCAALPTCSDSIKNQNETDIDCGGSTVCSDCANGKTCLVNADCLSNFCSNGVCATAASCSDGIKNQNETDIDCGGSTVCSDCANGKTCLINADCLSNLCSGGVCATAPSCSDSIKNQDETDVDCGGSVCADCTNGKMCSVNGDCISNFCSGGICATAPSCSDGIKNQNETDIDCGGSTVCSDCANGKICLVNADCISNNCVSGTCQASSGSANLRVQYFAGDTNPTNNLIKPNIRVYNDGTTTLNLSDIKFRYYFSQDGVASQAYFEYAEHVGGSWRSISSADVVYTLTSEYLEVGFTSGAGTLLAGSYVRVTTQIRNPSWSGNYNESNDYSFDGTITSYTNYNKVTAFYQGNLAWGIVP
jgi:hypothetical protein